MSLTLLLLAACRTTQPVDEPTTRAGTADGRAAAPDGESGLYAPDEALGDVFAGDWEYVGTGPWPGIERSQACAFRNGRVLIVNVYCTITERQAFRIDVLSPERGRIRIYAEANGPVSKRERGDYFTFTAESEPPLPQNRARPLSLAMSYQELRSYEQHRAEAMGPSCYGGERHSEKVGGCLGELAPRADAWAASSGGFLDRPGEEWYRVVREMRQLAAQHGVDPE